MVETGQLSAPDAAITMRSLVMSCIGQSLAKHTPLHREVVVVVERSELVNAPTHWAMVNDNTCEMIVPNGISTVVHIPFLSTAKANESYDVVWLWANGIISERNARVGGRLSEDSCVLSNMEVGSQRNDSAHVKDDNFLPISVYCSAKWTRSSIVEVGNMDDFSASAARNIASVTFCSRESGSLCPCSLQAENTEYAEHHCAQTVFDFHHFIRYSLVDCCYKYTCLSAYYREKSMPIYVFFYVNVCEFRFRWLRFASLHHLWYCRM